MSIRILSIGKTNIPFVKDGIDEYLKRLKHYAKVSWEELPDVKNSKKISTDQLKREEGKLFLGKLNTGDFIILLDENGQQQSSVEFSIWLENKAIHTAKDIIFIIGGAYGFSEELYATAGAKLSLSKMTFSHQIIRSIFVEQLYRAFTIQRGEPYHHV
jgi:23S rRNA (pseudouridine1915-N3)-methyltransferase